MFDLDDTQFLISRTELIDCSSVIHRVIYLIS